MGISEKAQDDVILPAPRSSGSFEGKVEESDDNFEVFKRKEGAVDFRTVGWIPASVIFLKIIFATGKCPPKHIGLVLAELIAFDRCTQYPICTLQPRIASRSHHDHCLGLHQYVLCHCPGQLQKKAPRLSQYRGHGRGHWGSSLQGSRWRLLYGCLYYLCIIWPGWCGYWTQCLIRPRIMYVNLSTLGDFYQYQNTGVRGAQD